MPETALQTDIRQRMQDCFKHTYGVENVKPEDRLVEDLDGDSLDSIELVLVVEQEFEIEIPDDEAEHIKTVGDATQLVTRILEKES